MYLVAYFSIAIRLVNILRLGYCHKIVIFSVLLRTQRDYGAPVKIVVYTSGYINRYAHYRFHGGFCDQ